MTCLHRADWLVRIWFPVLRQAGIDKDMTLFGQFVRGFTQTSKIQRKKWGG
jgi:hypothetical protein